MAVTLHKRLIAELQEQYPEIQTLHFWRTMRSLPDAEYVTSLLADDLQYRRWVKFVPDAWVVDVVEKHVCVFEVVDTHDISDEKFARMNDFAWALDEDYYSLFLIRVDAYGRTAYHVQTVGLTNQLEKLNAGEKPDNSWKIPGWQRFTMDYCNMLEAAE